MSKTISNNIKTAHLYHRAFGIMSFTWRDTSEWMTMIFNPEDVSKMPCIMAEGYQFHSKAVLTVEKAIARNIWNNFVYQGWTTTP